MDYARRLKDFCSPVACLETLQFLRVPNYWEGLAMLDDILPMLVYPQVRLRLVSSQTQLIIYLVEHANAQITIHLGLFLNQRFLVKKFALCRLVNNVSANDIATGKRNSLEVRIITI